MFYQDVKPAGRPFNPKFGGPGFRFGAVASNPDKFDQKIMSMPCVAKVYFNDAEYEFDYNPGTDKIVAKTPPGLCNQFYLLGDAKHTTVGTSDFVELSCPLDNLTNHRQRVDERNKTWAFCG